MKTLMKTCCALALAAMGTASAMAADPATTTDPVKAAEALNGSIEIKSQDGVVFVPVGDEKAAVPWRTSPVKIDGDLGEWTAGKPSAVLDDQKYVTWRRGAYGGKSDLTTSLWFARDDNYLYIAVQADDDKAPAPNKIEIAVADAKSPLITTWRDVGQRYGAHDIHVALTPGGKGSVKTTWVHAPRGWDADFKNNAFGTEEERRHFIEGLDDAGAHPKIYSAMTSRTENGRQITSFEMALPWRLVGTYYDPFEYLPIKLNVAVYDNDNGGGSGVMAWAPGIVGTYSAAHFPTLTFAPPADLKEVQAGVLLAGHHYVNSNLNFNFGLYNPTSSPIKATLEVYSKPGDEKKPLATMDWVMPPGYSRKAVPVPSESVGQTKCTFTGVVKLADGKVMTVPVHAPSLDDSVTIVPVAGLLKAIDKLDQQGKELAALRDQVKEKGLDAAYPDAYAALFKMFVARCQGDLRGGDTERVKNNCAYLDALFPAYKAYMEAILKDPSAQMKVPPRFDPVKLAIKEGFYYDGDRPVFLWGPCLFWYMKGDQHYAWELGFNSVGPEVPAHDEKQRAAIKTYLDAFEEHGMLVNASIGSSQFDELKKEHPEVANVDGNNFMSVIIQNPIVRKVIEQRLTDDINFFKQFPAVRSYWLWNEPAYSNYSEETRKDFIEQYVKPKYKTIEAANQRWNTQYKSYDDIQLLKGPNKEHYPQWYDFQQFQGDQLADFFGFLIKTAKSVDPTRPTHVKYMAISLNALDIARLQGPADISGYDGNIGDRDIIYVDFCRSLYPDKPIVNTEVHIWYRDYYTVAPVAWRLALHGVADANWWCWHSNPRFSNTVGSAESMVALTMSGLDIQRLFDPYIFALTQKPHSVATLFAEIVPQHSGTAVNQLRFEWGPAQYSLGIQPFYVTEDRSGESELAKRKLLIAGATDFVKDATYQSVLAYVKNGGFVILTPDAFAHNEYGDQRDTSELIKPGTGEAFTEQSKIYPVGKGQVVCVDYPAAQPKEKTPPALSKVAINRSILAKAMEKLGLRDDVSIRPDASDFLAGMDWRSTQLKDGSYVLCILPNDAPDNEWDALASQVHLVTAKPIKRIVNLISQAEVKPDAFKLSRGPNLYQIELEK